jgi:hypothetical protein
VVQAVVWITFRSFSFFFVLSFFASPGVGEAGGQVGGVWKVEGEAGVVYVRACCEERSESLLSGPQKWFPFFPWPGRGKKSETKWGAWEGSRRRRAGPMNNKSTAPTNGAVTIHPSISPRSAGLGCVDARAHLRQDKFDKEVRANHNAAGL